MRQGSRGLCFSGRTTLAGSLAFSETRRPFNNRNIHSALAASPKANPFFRPGKDYFNHFQKEVNDLFQQSILLSFLGFLFFMPHVWTQQAMKEKENNRMKPNQQTSLRKRKQMTRSQEQHMMMTTPDLHRILIST